MKTYVKIEGKDFEPAIKKLEQLAVESPQICVMDMLMDQEMPGPDTSITQINEEWTRTYFGLTEAVDKEECSKIVAKSRELGDSSLFFEWLQEPNKKMLAELKEKIDKTLKPLGVKYTVNNAK